MWIVKEKRKRGRAKIYVTHLLFEVDCYCYDGELPFHFQWFVCGAVVPQDSETSLAKSLDDSRGSLLAYAMVPALKLILSLIGDLSSLSF
jgi:hypothetical protein